MRSRNKRLTGQYSKWRFTIGGLLLSLAFCISGCQEPEEGCMEIAAANWNANADKSCEDCCTFPELSISFSHIMDTTEIVYGDTYLDDSSNPFQITSIRYYLSDFSLNSNGTSFRTTDSLEVEVDIANVNQTITIEDNFALASARTSSRVIGTFQNTNIGVDSITFYFGLDELSNSTDPLSVTSGHPLAIDSDTMYQDSISSYIFAKIGIVSDTMSQDTIIYTFTGNNFLEEIRLDWEENLDLGEDVIIPLKVDYSEWFTGINFAVDDVTLIKQIIASNFTKGFSIEE